MNNFIVRAISGAVFIAIVITCILFDDISFSILFGGIILPIMMGEYIKVSTANKLSKVGKILGVLAGVFFFFALVLVYGYRADSKYLFLTMLPLVGIFIVNLYVSKYNTHNKEIVNNKEVRVENGYEIFPFILSAFVYIALPISMMVLIVFDQNGNYSGNILLSMLIILWCSDVGAYCIGSILGQKFGKKLFISISPKKSWIGFWGGLTCSILGGITLYYSGLLSTTIIQTIILSTIICVFGVLGDLVESQLKRNFGVKDSGNIMPGHGGMLDRFDGALIAFPPAIIYLMFFVV